MTTANTHGARGNDGPTDNIKQGVFAGETRTITEPSIESIGPNGAHPFGSGVGPTGPFSNGKVPTKSQN